ncbi:MAG: hypothetical protein AAAFM81_13835, partial [Pseudomonadota bacterium]
MKRLVSLCAVAALGTALVACGKKDETPAAAEAVAESSILTYVPADTPYVFASLAPLPKGYLDKLAPLNNQVADSMSGMLEGVSAAIEQDAGDEDAEGAALMLRVAQVVMDVVKPETMKEFGFSMTSSSVIYGNGLLPVMRVELDQPEKFMPRFRALAEEESWALEDATAGDISYVKASLGEEAAILVAEADGMAVLTLVPSVFEGDTIGVLLGNEKPATSLADVDTLTALADKYALIPQGVGYLDLQQIASTFIDGPSGAVDTAIFALGGESPAAGLDDVCKAEIKSLVGVMPRLALGYQSISADRMDLLTVAELRDDIAAALQPVAGSVPGMTSDSDAMMKFGLGLDLKGMRGFVEDKMTAVADNPYECAALDGMNMAAVQMVQSINQPVPPLVYNFKGFFVELDNLDGINLESPSVPESIDANAVLAFDNVEGLIAMGQMMLPPLGMMELAADGEPVQIPQEMLTGYAGEVFAAMTENTLALSSGKGASGNAKSLASSTDGADPALMVMSVDLAGYMTLMGDIQESAFEDLGEMEGMEDDQA